MGGLAALGTLLKMGTCQVETATVVGTITLGGNATFTVTMAGMTGSPIAKSVAVLLNDTADTVATKARAALLADANITAKMSIGGSGSQIVATALVAAANDGTMNIAIANGTCTGLTPAASSADTKAGVVLTTVANVSSIGGPAISADTDDVSAHDSVNAFEEAVATILRTGELSIDVNYDPNAATHAATSGLIYKAKNKELAQFQIAFVGGVNWDFAAYVTGFEPKAPANGKLTATVKCKLTGSPTLR